MQCFIGEIRSKDLMGSFTSIYRCENNIKKDLKEYGWEDAD